MFFTICIYYGDRTPMSRIKLAHMLNNCMSYILRIYRVSRGGFSTNFKDSPQQQLIYNVQLFMQKVRS